MERAPMADVRRVAMLPHSIEAEQALLGGLMLDDPTAWARIHMLVGAADFYSAAHRNIFNAIEKLNDKRQAADPVSVSEYLERTGAIGDTGGLPYIGRLAADTPSAAHVETYASTVRDRR
jgi:replicative DNA helicase